MGKSLIEILENRHSVRVFKHEQIAKETIDKLKELTLRAPSAGDMQLYSIIEVTDDTVKDKLSILCDNQPIIARAPLVWIFLADNNKWEEYFRASKSELKTGIGLRETSAGDLFLTMQDAIITASYAAIAAEALGLGSCFIGDVIENCEKMRELLSLPDHAVPAAMLIMGIPADEKEKKELTPRPPIDSDIFMENAYKEPTKDSLEKEYSNHNDYMIRHKKLPKGNLTTIADEIYSRKYTSAFMEEMNRSCAEYLRIYLK